MAATVQVNEYNGTGQDKTGNISNTNMGSTDDANLDPVANPVAPGDNTFEKWQSLEVTSMGGSSQIENIKVWRTGALGGSASHVTNARESSYSEASYATPTDSNSTEAAQTMPTSEPSGANLGIGGSLTGNISSPGETDLLVHQIQTDAGDTAGTTSTMNYQYDEIA
jgi:hypothetical protein